MLTAPVDRQPAFNRHDIITNRCCDLIGLSPLGGAVHRQKTGAPFRAQETPETENRSMTSPVQNDIGLDDIEIPEYFSPRMTNPYAN